MVKKQKCLLDYLDGALWALCFTSATNEALVNLDGCGFAVFHLINAYRTGVYAGFASIAFVAVNHYFYHVFSSIGFYQKLKGKIKAFR
jgi:hypothetical protein